jgi:hypothetical protein
MSDIVIYMVYIPGIYQMYQPLPGFQMRFCQAKAEHTLSGRDSERIDGAAPSAASTDNLNRTDLVWPSSVHAQLEPHLWTERQEDLFLLRTEAHHGLHTYRRPGRQFTKQLHN